jgi:hypothetical protein
MCASIKLSNVISGLTGKIRKRTQMADEMKKKRGAPKGNQNARKHGFYSSILDESQQQDLELALNVDGVDDEIALLRVKIKSVLEYDPENINLITRATNTLERLIRTRYNLSKEQKPGLKESITNVIKDVALPLGIDIFTTLKK